jgi:phosphonate transport system ATP-binding protein
MLKIQNLSKTYGASDQALCDIDLEIPSGQVLALIGPSGAGKSTLIRCINRLVEPTSGHVYLSDLEITGLGKGKLRRARRDMGMIFQEYALVERLTVMENVLSGQLGYVNFFRSFLRRFPPGIVAEAYELLGRVELQEHFNKRADELSGGQRQRVGIARAMLQHPNLLLVDEPTASLDPRTSRQIMRLLCDICRERGLAAIINIHDVDLAKMFVERIVGLRDGKTVFDGTPDQLGDDTLTEIYGAEDWSATRDTTDSRSATIAGHEPDDEHMAGLR